MNNNAASTPYTLFQSPIEQTTILNLEQKLNQVLNLVEDLRIQVHLLRQAQDRDSQARHWARDCRAQKRTFTSAPPKPARFSPPSQSVPFVLHNACNM